MDQYATASTLIRAPYCLGSKQLPPSLVVRNKATCATLHLRGNHAKLHQASPVKFNNFITQKYAFKNTIWL
jgi:hypothetical protein